MTKENKIIKKTVFLSAEDKQQQFQKELKELLVIYDAVLVTENFGRFYNHEIKMIADFKWDRDLYDETGNGAVPRWVIGQWEDGK